MEMMDEDPSLLSKIEDFIINIEKEFLTKSY